MNDGSELADNHPPQRQLGLDSQVSMFSRHRHLTIRAAREIYEVDFLLPDRRWSLSKTCWADAYLAEAEY